jgi:DNA-binding transcriptional MerR regulator
VRVTMLYRTGAIARKLGKSREVLLVDLRILGIEPQRDSAGHRLLTEDDVRRLLILHRERLRRQQLTNARSSQLAPISRQRRR